MKPLLVFVFSILLTAVLSGQNLADLTSPIYRDLDRWEVQGLIRQLPLLKPYGGRLVEGFLDQVIANGTERDRELAQKYKEKLLGPVGLKLDFADLEYASSEAYFALRTGALHFQGKAGDLVHIDGNLDTAILQTSVNDPRFLEKNLAPAVLPAGQPLPQDWFVDQTADRVGDQWLAVTPVYSSLVSLGTTTASFQMGTSRASFGDFLGDGIVVSPQSVQAPQLSFSWIADTTIISFLTMDLTASDWRGKGKYTGKYLSLSTLQWKPFSTLEFDAWQTAVYGQRIALEYLIPGIYFLSAEQNGNTDNMFLGGGGKLFLPGDLKLTAKLYLDDFQIMKFLFGDSHTGLKAAIQADLDWQPSFLPGLSVETSYAAVTPYTYSHVPAYIDEVPPSFDPMVNYLDYSHSGKNLGLSLGPNSDRAAVQVQLDGPAGSQWGWEFTFTRHGNASEGADATDYPYLTQTQQGTVFDHGYDLLGVGKHLFSDAPFLGQPTIESHAQSTLSASLPLPLWNLTMSGGVTVEYAWNRGLVAGVDGWMLYLAAGLTWTL